MKLSEKGIIIRKTTEADLPQIYSEGRDEPVFKDLHFGFNAENLAEIFASDNSVYLTAVRKKKVLGFIIGSLDGNETIVHWFMVKKNLRKTGIGNELLKLYAEYSKKNGAENFLIAVFKNNTESMEFFTGRGFSLRETYCELYREI